MDDDDTLGPVAIGARALALAVLAYWAWRMAVEPMGSYRAEVEGHDGEAILGALGWLPYDVALGLACHRAGVLVMLGAIAWAGWVLREQHRRLRTADDPA